MIATHRSRCCRRSNKDRRCSGLRWDLRGCREHNLKCLRVPLRRKQILPVPDLPHAALLRVGVGQPHQRGRRLIVGRPGLGISEVQWLRQIHLLQQMASEPSNVGYLKNKMLRQFASDGKINHLRVRSSHAVVNSPADVEAAVRAHSRRCVRKAPARRWWQFGHWRPSSHKRTGVARGHHREPGESRNAIHG